MFVLSGRRAVVLCVGLLVCLAAAAEGKGGESCADDDRYHPSDFVHGILASHAYRKVVAEGDEVAANLDKLRKHFNVSEPADKDAVIARVLRGWRVYRIINESTSGYYGVIYMNEARKQIVLSHRGTAVLGSMIEDVDGVLGGNITPFQLHLKNATKQTVDLIVKSANYSDYALSFTGHSLGGWLADLSVYYCHQFFGYKNVKAVTFDSPGSEFMINSNLEQNVIKGPNDVFRAAKDLDIVAYLSMPNVLNSINRHIGTVYLLDNVNDKHVPVNFVESCLMTMYGVKHLSKGHRLQEILPKFDPISGKPSRLQKALRWPSITLSRTSATATSVKHNNTADADSLENAADPEKALQLQEQLQQQQQQQPTSQSGATTTLHLTLVVLKDWIFGNIRTEQYTRVGRHSFKDEKNDVEIRFNEFLAISPQRLDTRKRSDTIDAYIVELLLAHTEIVVNADDHRLADDVAFIRRYCKYDRVSEELSVSTPALLMSEVRDKARRIYHKYPRIEQIERRGVGAAIIGAGGLIGGDVHVAPRGPRFANEFLLSVGVASYVETVRFELVDGAFQRGQAVLVTGVAGVGKSTFASQYTRHFVAMNTPDHCTLAFKLARHGSSRLRHNKQQQAATATTSVRNEYFAKLIDLLFAAGDERDEMRRMLVDDDIEQLNKRVNSKLVNTGHKFLFVFDDLDSSGHSGDTDGFISDDDNDDERVSASYWQDNFNVLALIVGNLQRNVRILVTSRLRKSMFTRHGLPFTAVFQLDLFSRNDASRFLRNELADRLTTHESERVIESILKIASMNE